MPRQVYIQLTPLRSCLANLPAAWSNSLLDQKKVPQNVILELSWKDGEAAKKAYVGWSGESAKVPANAPFVNGGKPLEILELDPQFAQACGIANGQKVSVDFGRNVPECETVNVEPYTEDDWEILELHAGYVEENLLSQLRVVYPNQLITIWIHGRTLVRLQVGEMSPKAPYIKLTNITEVIVAPKVRNKNTKVFDETTAINDLQKQQTSPHICLRALPHSYSKKTFGENLDIYVNPDSADNLNNCDHVRITKVNPAYAQNDKQQHNQQQNGDEKEGESATPEKTKATFAKLVFDKSIPKNHVSIDEVTRLTLGIKTYDIVKLSVIAIKPTNPSNLIIKSITSQPVANNMKLGLNAGQEKDAKDSDLIASFREKLQQSSPETIVLTNNSIINMEHSSAVLVQFNTAKKGLFGSTTPQVSGAEEEQYCVFSKKQFDGCQIEVGSAQIMDVDTTEVSLETQPELVLGGVEETYNKILEYAKTVVVKHSLRASLSVPGSGGVLLTGSHGSGKTSIMDQVISRLKNDTQALTYSIAINCAEVADERVPILKDNLQKWFDEAAWHAPSIIFFDDFDRLIPAEVEHADSFRSKQLAEIFMQIVKNMTNRHPIVVVATSQQQQSVHPALVNNHIFNQLYHLNPPGRDERKQILHAIMTRGHERLSKSVVDLDLVSIATETEGYLAADLKALIERAVHEGAVRSIKQRIHGSTNDVDSGVDVETPPHPFTLTQEDFQKAQEGFVPSSLRGVKLQSSGVNWADIGGLNETRKTLLETLEWPTKYASIFANCPLRLRSGLLLFGYPGCGKTLLASAVAKECGLNFISVKGPEILNKYIGASEKSVRDLFERAQAARPCVLFFDEFDSIAPRRGHDSTGVTDRVVNQMLTQMDGAEGLDGVYVLAATSRPDLIDPALLRPGRLDKALLCGMPDVQERLEILQALARKMTLADNVDLEYYAERTEGLSGADLQAFLYNAHLESIHSAIAIESFEQRSKGSGTPQDEKSTFVIFGGKQGLEKKAPMTLAERGQIENRLNMIKKAYNAEQEQNTNAKTPQADIDQIEEQKHSAIITLEHLEKSLKNTRPSNTIEEHIRLKAIYDEFVTGRTGELPSGEAAKGIGKRTTLG
ncbi:hypothetical protein NQZ79_g8299 [Umbelopsis isabellina]|nr:hypothetical protein NQZ79_g8299 [Umbelopsis isabellina]